LIYKVRKLTEQAILCSTKSLNLVSMLPSIVEKSRNPKSNCFNRETWSDQSQRAINCEHGKSVTMSLSLSLTCFLEALTYIFSLRFEFFKSFCLMGQMSILFLWHFACCISQHLGASAASQIYWVNLSLHVSALRSLAWLLFSGFLECVRFDFFNSLCLMGQMSIL
jgi:hypothetical protein